MPKRVLVRPAHLLVAAFLALSMTAASGGAAMRLKGACRPWAR